MNAITSTLAVAAAVYLGLTTPSHKQSAQAIDAIIGEGSYNTVIPVAPGDRASIDRQLTYGLERIERLLRGRDVSQWPADMQAAREKTLCALHAYWTVGVYSTNYDHPDQFLPCFMDRDGGYCAVAFLMAQSGDMALADELNSKYQYATIAEMKSPKLDDWIARSGLTRAEVITVQRPEFIMSDSGTLTAKGSTIRRDPASIRIDGSQVGSLINVSDSVLSIQPPALTPQQPTSSPTISDNVDATPGQQASVAVIVDQSPTSPEKP